MVFLRISACPRCAIGLVSPPATICQTCQADAEAARRAEDTTTPHVLSFDVYRALTPRQRRRIALRARR